MFLRELCEVSQIWSRQGGKQVRKYRCTSGIRKGRVMASPASCNRPLNIHKSAGLAKTKRRTQSKITMTGARTRRINPASNRLKSLNKAKNRKSHNRGGRRI